MLGDEEEQKEEDEEYGHGEEDEDPFLGDEPAGGGVGVGVQCFVAICGSLGRSPSQYVRIGTSRHYGSDV